MYEEDYVAHGLSVVGTTIYVKSGRSFHSYNVNTKIWDSLGYSTSTIPIPLPLLPRFIGKFVPAYDDIFIGLHHHNLFAALIPRDGSPLTYQYLIEVFDEYFYYNIAPSSGAVEELGEQEMCIIKIGFLPGIHITAYIATFQVEKLHSLVQPSDLPLINGQHSPVPKDCWPVPYSEQLVPVGRFLSVTCLTKGHYNLDAWGIDMPTISCAFLPIMVCLESFLVFFYILCLSYITLYLFTLFCICIVPYCMFVSLFLSHVCIYLITLFFAPCMHVFVLITIQKVLFDSL